LGRGMQKFGAIVIVEELIIKIYDYAELNFFGEYFF
jgi:hypothetical protein